MADLKYIYHKTKTSHLDGIISSKYIYNQIDRKKKEIYNEYEGLKNRRIAKSDISINKYKNGVFWKDYDEAIGIYLRPYLEKPKLKPQECIIVLDFKKIREDGIKWLINTEENHGFYINKPGYEALSPYSGEYGVTYDETNWKNCMTNNLSDRSEVLLEESIYITPYLIKIETEEELFSSY